MDKAVNETIGNSLAPRSGCSSKSYASVDEMMESEWEELVIKFDRSSGKHVVRTACCPMAPVC